MFDLSELYDEACNTEWVLDSLDDSKKFYTNVLSNSVGERNRVCHDAIDNIDKTIEMVHKHNPGIDAISGILCAINSWNSADADIMVAYSGKRYVLNNTLSVSEYGILDMYNRDIYYLKSFVAVLEEYSNTIEDFDKVVYDDSEDMILIKNFNNVEELDLEKAQNVSKILSITNRLYTYYVESLKMLQ